MKSPTDHDAATFGPATPRRASRASGMTIVANGGDTRLSFRVDARSYENWPACFAALEAHVSAVRDAVHAHGAANRASGAEPLGIGLSLPSVALDELESPGTLARLRAWLDAERCRVHAIDGEPSGEGDGEKDIGRDDRSDPARLDHVRRLATLLATLTPSGAHGSVTVRPGAFTTRTCPARETVIAEGLLQAVAHCVRLERDGGACIALAIEAEPGGSFETSDGTVRFFERHLLSMAGVGRLAALCELPAPAARQALLRHLGTCHDVRRSALRFESPRQALERYAAAGIDVIELRLGSALRIGRVNEAALRRLSRLDEPSRPHPVVERCGGTLTRYAGLGAAIDAARYRLERRSTLDPRLQAPLARGALSSVGVVAAWQPVEEPPSEWRLRFDAPLFLASVGMIPTTQDALVEALTWQRTNGLCRHLQIEPCTPHLLPAELREGALAGVIARELDWVRATL